MIYKLDVYFDLCHRELRNFLDAENIKYKLTQRKHRSKIFINLHCSEEDMLYLELKTDFSSFLQELVAKTTWVRAEEDISKVLAEEIRAEIDNEVLMNLKNAAREIANE